MKRFVAALVVIVWVLAACGQPSSQALPTLFPTPGGAAVSTETPVPQATTQPTAEPLTRPTLPPTWTPDSSKSTGGDTTLVTPTPESLNTPLPAPTALPSLVACGTFVVDRQNSASTFKAGETPKVLWSKVDGAARYRVRLLDATGAEVFVDYTLEPTYTFRADLFKRDQVFAWSVYPEDSLGRQMCLEQGIELYPQ